MNLAPLLVESEKRYKLLSSKSINECVVALTSIFAVDDKDKTKALVGLANEQGFKVSKRSKFGFPIFQPTMAGTFETGADGTQVLLQLSLNPQGQAVLNAPANILVGAVLGVIACSMILNDAIAISYAFLLMVMVPAVIMIAAAIAASCIVGQDSKFIAQQITDSLNATTAKLPAQHLPLKQICLQESFSLASAVILFVAFTWYLHSSLWTLWCNGSYLQVEAFCRPVYEFTTTLFGESSGAASDCRFFLAESLRCRGRLKESQQLYQKSIDLFEGKKDSRSVFLADNIFGLARIEDQSGRHLEAETLYNEAIDLWSKAKEIGPGSIWVSRALDRLAMLDLKEHKYDQARLNMDQALKIDQALGPRAGRSVGEDLNDLALVFDNQEDYNKAGELYTQALYEKERVSGKNDYSTGTTLYNLADIRKFQHRLKESQQLSQRAASIWARWFEGTALSYPDIMQQYRDIMARTRPEYEIPRVDTRFDGLRPYLGRY